MIIDIEDKENYFKNLSSLPVPTVVADVESRLILYANPEAQKLWMCSYDELVGKEQTVLHSDYWNEKGRDAFLEHVKILKSGQVMGQSRNAALRSDGKEIPIEISAIMIKLAGKHALVGTFISVEQREKAFMLLKSRESELEAILNNSQIGVMYLKGNRLIKNANQRLADILGYESSKEMIGISMEQLHLSSESYEWFGKYHYEPLRLNVSTHIQYKLRKKNGEAVWISLSGKAVDNSIPSDLEKGVIWVVDDISDFKDLEEKLQSNNKRLNNLLQNINGISWEFDLVSNMFTYVSPNAQKILGYEQEEWSSFESWKMMVHPDDRERVASYCMIETKKGEDHLMEYRMIKRDGSVVWVLDIVTLGKDKNNTPITLYGFILDVTKSKNDQLKIESEQKHLQSIIDGVHDSIMVIRDDYTVEVMNKTLQEHITKVTIADPKQPKCYEVSHGRTTPCDGDAHPCPLKEVIESKLYTKVIHNHKDESGSDHYVELGATPLFDEEDRFIGIIESARDITEHLETLDELKVKSALLDFQAHHDELTGLPNRTLYQDRIEQAIQKSKRFNRKFVLLFIDLDRFKEVNDLFGHHVGDKVLLEASRRLNECLRAEDTLARLGGDEFTVLLEVIEKIQDISLVTEKILQVFRKPFTLEGHTLYLSCSIGISIYPDDGIEASDLLKNADNAMYKAKTEGRDNYQFYTKEMTEIVFERVMLESSIRQAILNNEFVLYYQPQYNGKSKTIIGMEALIRWNHPSMGIIPPSKFIPFAEESGLIIEIDNWVLKTALKELSAWHKLGLKTGTLSLNLAIKQLESESFFELLKSTIHEISFNPQWLKLEILERDVMHNPEETIKKLTMIHSLGIKLAVDDFGVGHSSLAYLKKFPLDQLKIDQSFIRDLDKDKESNAIVLAVIAVAKALSLEIIAEGVETKEQLDFLLKNKCDGIQGYYFSPPIDTEGMKKILEEG